MAKVSKKVSRKKTKTKVVAKRTKPVPEVAAPVEEGCINVAFVPSDLSTLTTLLSQCAQYFEQVALQSIEKDDKALFEQMSAIYKLSNAYAARLAQFTTLGEPESRNIH